MGKAVFIDFDGTLADRGQVPDAHLTAVRKARANGHYVLLCTGRPRAMVPDAIVDAFDGFVGAGGGYVEIGGEVLADVRFPEAVAARTVGVLTDHDVTFLLEAPESVYAPLGTPERMRVALSATNWTDDRGGGGADDILESIITRERLDEVSFGKIAIFHSPTPLPELVALIGPEVGALPNSITGLSGHSGEIYLHGLTKAVGMAVAAAHLGVETPDLIAIGDSHNDVEMLAHAGTAVAVTGAPEPVVALADHLIAAPEHEGLVEGFVTLGLVTS